MLACLTANSSIFRLLNQKITKIRVWNRQNEVAKGRLDSLLFSSVAHVGMFNFDFGIIILILY